MASSALPRQLGCLARALRPTIEQSLPAQASSVLDGLYTETLAALPSMAVQVWHASASPLDLPP